MANISKQDLLEYKEELLTARKTIIEGKPTGLAEIDKKVAEYKKDLIQEYDIQLFAEIEKCDIELRLIDRLIVKSEQPDQPAQAEL